jgi:hypothetical protein
MDIFVAFATGKCLDNNQSVGRVLLEWFLGLIQALPGAS